MKLFKEKRLANPHRQLRSDQEQQEIAKTSLNYYMGNIVGSHAGSGAESQTTTKHSEHLAKWSLLQDNVIENFN